MTIETYDEAARQYVKLRNIGKPVSDADILIAAFCIVNDLIFVTHNTKHFVNIDELRIEDWMA